jgi:DNA repair exonuclease SbcCD ATPase subunit
MAWDGMRSTGLGARGAWAVGMIALLAAVATFFFGSYLHNLELKRHVLDLTAHPGGLEAINQDLTKFGNIVAEHREILRLVPEIRSRLEHLESWEADLARGVQALAQIEKLSKTFSELSIATTSRCEGLAGSLRELRNKVVDLESARQRLAGLEKLAGELVAIREAVGRLDGLSEKVAQAANLAASLPQEISALKEGLAPLADLPEKMDKMAEQSAERSAALAEELARVKQQLDQQKKLVENVEKLQAEVADLSGLSGEIGKLQQQSEELGEAAGKAGEVVAKLSEVEDLKAQVAELAKTTAAIQARPVAVSGEGGVAQAVAVDSSAIQGLAAELAEMKKAVGLLQAEQPNLDVNIKEAKLVSQQDRTVIVCTLTVRNLSNKPNEITAVRVELDSGRSRMAPTAVRHWLPDGKQTNEERLILLPQKVLEKSTTAPITLTAIGWPLEKAQESYAFRITLRDKNGNEYIKNHQLVSEPAAT